METRAPILVGLALALALGGAIGAGSALIVTAQPAAAIVATDQVDVGGLPLTPDIEPPPRRPDQIPPRERVWLAPDLPSLPDGVVAPIE
jgi:hypothetical protein